MADELAHYVRSGAIDGLNLAPNAVPTGFDDVVDRLVPALQERGVYPGEYPGGTLRENLGLRFPVAHRELSGSPDSVVSRSTARAAG